MSVEYRDIPGFPGYRIGNDGTVLNSWINCRSGRSMTDRWKPMKLAVNEKGYHSINLTPPGERYKTCRVHRLVLLAFVGPCPEGMECRHLNGIKTDNRPENLAWGTFEENCDDNRESGAYKNHSRISKYTHDGKTMCLKDWARHFSVPYATLYQRTRLLGMTFEEAISKPFLGVAGNGPKPKRKSLAE